MYLETDDYMTIWKLGHHWAGYDEFATNSSDLPKDLKQAIYRMMHAIIGRSLPARTRNRLIFEDEHILTILLDLSHLLNFRKCLRKGIFDKDYLDSIYLKRPHVLAWCEKDFLTPPKMWQIAELTSKENTEEYDSSEDDNDDWYGQLTERRKQRVACLEMAKKLWLIHPLHSYEQIYNHSAMKQFGNPNVFSFDAFKKWSRPFAPPEIKEGGRPNKNR